MTTIYVVALEHGKFFVGTLYQVFEGHSSWISLHKPLHLYISNEDEDEDKLTLELMDKYGINNVRGGTYSQINLSNQTKNFILMKLLNMEEEALDYILHFPAFEV